jgi:hypothetical protein
MKIADFLWPGSREPVACHRAAVPIEIVQPCPSPDRGCRAAAPRRPGPASQELTTATASISIMKSGPARGVTPTVVTPIRPPLRNRKFVDSPQEGTGFEPSVALRKGSLGSAERRCRTDRLDGIINPRSSRETSVVARGSLLNGRLVDDGTDGSNPSPSCGESSKLRHHGSWSRRSSELTRHSGGEQVILVQAIRAI